MAILKWDVSKEDSDKILAVVEKAEGYGWKGRRRDTLMDLTACHANGTPLDFDRMLTFDRFNLLHDVHGIAEHMDRDTGQLGHHFLPRGAKRG